MDVGIMKNALLKYEQDKAEYARQSQGKERFLIDESKLYPCLTDYTEQAGSISLDYFFQDIYVAGKVAESGISHIFDIGSRLDGYISHLLAMQIQVTMIDIRPLEMQVENLDFVQGNAMELSGIGDETIDTLSCLHTLEHFGLGRYGDPVDYYGWEKAIVQFKRVLAPGGLLFLSVPSGATECVMFNAHRIFRPRTIYDAFCPEMKLLEFSNLQGSERITLDFRDGEDSREDIEEALDIFANEYMGQYDCGIYIFKKEI